MSDGEQRDRLIEVLLHEVLGGEEPPDLTERVMARAFPRRSFTEVSLVPGAIAAGVLVVLAVVLALTSGRREAQPSYPGPQAAGGVVRIEGGGDLARGATLSTGAQEASVELGGYCHIAIAPQTSLRLEGGPKAEQVFLSKGALACEVEREHGTFAVQTDIGTVRVTGTKFSVEVAERKAKGPMVKKAGKVALALTVAVMAGSVTVDYAGKSCPLAAGARQVFAADEAPVAKLPDKVRGFSGEVRGMVVEKAAERTIKLEVLEVLRVWEKNKAEDPQALAGLTVTVGPAWQKNKADEWQPVELHLAFLDKLQAGQEIKLEVRNAEADQFAIAELSQEQRDWASGAPKQEEKVAAKKEAAGEAKPAEGAKEKGVQEGVPHKEKGGEDLSTILDKKVTLMPPYPLIHEGAPTDRISVQYAVAEVGKQVGLGYDYNASSASADPMRRNLITPKIKEATCSQALREILEPQGLRYTVVDRKIVLQKAEGEPKEAKGAAAQEPKAGQEGTASGIVTAKEKNWIEVKLDGVEGAQRFMPQWQGGNNGGLCPQMLEAIAKTPIAARVELKWKKDEHLRVLAIRVVAPPAKEGVVLGTIVDKGENWIDIKPKDAGPTERYMPRWTGGKEGGSEPKMREAIGHLEVGDHVRVRWTYDERKRIVDIEKIGSEGK